MTWDWILAWLVMPGVVTAALIVGALWLANRT